MKLAPRTCVRGMAVALLFSSAIGCANGPTFPEPEAPNGVIPRDTFVHVLTEVQLIEGALKQRLFRNDNETERVESQYAELFDRWNVSEERFKSTYTWWYQRPEALDGLMEDVIENLTVLERRLVEEERIAGPSPVISEEAPRPQRERER